MFIHHFKVALHQDINYLVKHNYLPIIYRNRAINKISQLIEKYKKRDYQEEKN